MRANQPLDLKLPSTPGSWLEHAPLPMVAVESATHLVGYANLAFCRMINSAQEDIVRKPFCALLPDHPRCLALLDDVYRTGKIGILQGQEHSGPGPTFSSYVMWPVMSGDRTLGVVIQVTETAPLHARTMAMNEALVLGSLRQHELAASSDEANVILQAEIGRRIRSEREALMLTKSLGEANATLSALATTDALTGLPNRRLFDERLAAEWQRALQQHSSLAVVLIDVDHFKKYNDRFGHPSGDECLRRVARAISAGKRKADLAARVGGEEFGLLLSGTDAGGAAVLAESMRMAVEQLGLDHPLSDIGVVTISLGIAAGMPEDWGDQARLFAAADQALYEAKATGRNRICTTGR
jgi:diguanylate cyclase (GGDEF)-like protein